MQHGPLADRTLATNHIPTQSASSGAKNGTAIDMSGWDGVAFYIHHGTFGVNATLDGLVQRDDNSGFNSPTNIANTSLAQIINANGVAIVDVYRPSERYVRMQLTPGTNAVLFGCTAIQYRRSGTLPPTQSAVQVVQIAEN